MLVAVRAKRRQDLVLPATWCLVDWSSIHCYIPPFTVLNPLPTVAIHRTQETKMVDLTGEPQSPLPGVAFGPPNEPFEQNPQPDINAEIEALRRERDELLLREQARTLREEVARLSREYTGEPQAADNPPLPTATPNTGASAAPALSVAPSVDDGDDTGSSSHSRSATGSRGTRPIR